MEKLNRNVYINKGKIEIGLQRDREDSEKDSELPEAKHQSEDKVNLPGWIQNKGSIFRLKMFDAKHNGEQQEKEHDYDSDNLTGVLIPAVYDTINPGNMIRESVVLEPAAATYKISRFVNAGDINLKRDSESEASAEEEMLNIFDEENTVKRMRTRDKKKSSKMSHQSIESKLNFISLSAGDSTPNEKSYGSKRIEDTD